jgi:DNA-binding ferritin-like protein
MTASPQQVQQVVQQNSSLIQQIKALLDQGDEVDTDQVKELLKKLETNNQQLASGEQAAQPSTRPQGSQPR